MNLNQINFNVKGQHFNIADYLEKNPPENCKFY